MTSPTLAPRPASVEEALLRDIVTDPHDVAARLICADWLEEQGRDGRAELIRAGVRMHDHTDCPTLMRDRVAGRPRPLRCGTCRYCIDRQACERLYVGVDWSRECGLPAGTCYSYSLDPGLDLYLPPSHDSFHFLVRRGFVEAATLPLADWLEHGAELVMRMPLVRVTLSDREPGAVPPVDDWPQELPAWYWFFMARNGQPLHPHWLPRRFRARRLWPLKKAQWRHRVPYFLSHQAAHAALSHACLALARKRAGLPPLPPPPAPAAQESAR